MCLLAQTANSQSQASYRMWRVETLLTMRAVAHQSANTRLSISIALSMHGWSTMAARTLFNSKTGLPRAQRMWKKIQQRSTFKLSSIRCGVIRPFEATSGCGMLIPKSHQWAIEDLSRLRKSMALDLWLPRAMRVSRASKQIRNRVTIRSGCRALR